MQARGGKGKRVHHEGHVNVINETQSGRLSRNPGPDLRRATHCDGSMHATANNGHIQGGKARGSYRGQKWGVTSDFFFL